MKIKQIVALLTISSASAFSVGSNTAPETSRRSWLASGVAAFLVGVPCTSSAKGSDALGKGTPVGREIDTFNSLIYNFKNVDLGGGLDASTLSEFKFCSDVKARDAMPTLNSEAKQHSVAKHHKQLWV